MVDNLRISCILPPPPPPHLFAQDKSSRAARSAVFGEKSKWWTKIHTRLTWVSRVKKAIQQFYWLITFFGFIEDKAILQRRLRCKIAQKCLAISICGVQFLVHILASDQKKVLFFRATFDTKSNFWFIFFSNFWATFWEITSNVWKISSNLWKALCETGSGRSSNCIMELFWRQYLDPEYSSTIFVLSQNKW